MNVIIENRIVSDITFAPRLASFLENVVVSDFMSEEELKYLQNISKKLLSFQIQTVTDSSERIYLTSLKYL